MNDSNDTNSGQTEGFAEIISKAQQGDHKSMGQVAEAAEARLLTYIFRLTLSRDLAEELCQKTLVKMVQSLNTLKNINQFWNWLLRHAMGEVQHYYRDQRRRRQIEIEALNQEYFKQYVARNHHDGLDESARIELSEIIYESIAQLKLTYRSVLVLRCYENMSFAEIAQLLNCKEFGARVLFFRAKHALKQHLSRHGFGKEMLMTGLGLFGILTVSTKATSTACSVNTASMSVGIGATLAGSLYTKTGIAFITTISAIAAGVTFEHIVGSVVLIAVIFFGLIVVGLYFCLD